MPIDYSKYLFAPGSRSIVIVNLKKFLNARAYLKVKNNSTNIFDSQMQTSLVEYQKHHRLLKQDGLFDQATYAQFGKEMTDIDIDRISLNEPNLNKLFYGIGLVEICENRDTVATFISKEKFIGWGHPDVKNKNCYDYCVKQLKDAGYSLKSPGWSAAQIANTSVYQTYLTKDVAGLKKGHIAEQFTAGVLYLKKAMQSKIPVMVGVEHSDGSSSADKVTDHYVIIVGMGTDTKGKYFSFYDNSTGNVDVGASAENKIYCDCEKFTLIGVGDPKNQYIQSGFGQYVVT